MKCPKCNEGQFMAKGSRMSKRTGFWTRHRICNKCGYTDTTVEISKKNFSLEMELLDTKTSAMEKYNFEKQKQEKPEDADKDVA